MNKRMVVSALALVGVFLAAYLTLYKLGMIGALSCSIGECETVNLSRWARFLGLPVAAWGVGFYLTVFLVAFLGTTRRFADATWVSHVLLGLTAWGVVFSTWLTYLELFVIHAICMWCLISAILVAAIFAVCVLEWRDRPTAQV
ncbi:MAG TPA: vitamin K epoxide reductase family protein [Gemmatimonadaceae bacterium]